MNIAVIGEAGSREDVRRPQAEEANIPVDNGRGGEKIAGSSIAAARIEEGVVFLLMRNGERLIFEQSLNDLEALLDSQHFFRVSRQAIVNEEAISSSAAQHDGSAILVLDGSWFIRVSRRRARALRPVIKP